MFNDLEDIINSLDNNIKKSYNGDDIILTYRYETIYLRPSYLYENLIFLYSIFFNMKNMHLIHINNLHRAIKYYLNYDKNSIIEFNSAIVLKYGLIRREEFIELINYNNIHNPLLIDSNEYENDIIILEKSNRLFKLPFSNIYINTYFYYKFIANRWDLIPLVSYLKKKRKEYTCQIINQNEYNNNIEVKVKINEFAFKEAAKLLNNDGLLSFLNVNQFRILA